MQWENERVDFILHPAEARVLGSLLEKDITTPEYYPLTLNALIAASNQKSNRDPVVSYDDQVVTRALESLRAKGFVSSVVGGHNRVPKYAHRFSERLNLGRRELAILCELMVRGPQTPGELRNRASRMYPFSDLDEVETCLRGLMERAPDPLVTRLPHAPGTKEARYAHLLSGEPAVPAAAPVEADAPLPFSMAATEAGDPNRLARLEEEVSSLRDEVSQLRQQIEEFRRQFE
jgi:uncharacterized protein YceH (UPF0502 family)